MVSISFEQPLYLLALFLLPLLVFIHIVSLKLTRNRALKFANFDAIGKIKGIDFFSKNIVALILNATILLLVSFSLANITLHVDLDASSHSFVLALDNSKSMEADDLLPSRMVAAQSAAIQFVNDAPIGTRFGVISFSGNAFIEQGMTDRRVLVRSAIENIFVSDIAGTDMAETVVTATNILQSEESKAIIILSDGQINIGSVPDLVEYANENGVLIHTIAVGTPSGGTTSFGVSTVDSNTLSALAYNTGGQFFEADSILALDQSFADAIELTRRKVAIPIGEYLLLFALLLFLLNYFLLNTRYRRIP